MNPLASAGSFTRHFDGTLPGVDTTAIDVISLLAIPALSNQSLHNVPPDVVVSTMLPVSGSNVAVTPSPTLYCFTPTDSSVILSSVGRLYSSGRSTVSAESSCSSGSGASTSVSTASSTGSSTISVGVVIASDGSASDGVSDSTAYTEIPGRVMSIDAAQKAAISFFQLLFIFTPLRNILRHAVNL